MKPITVCPSCGSHAIQGCPQGFHPSFQAIEIPHSGHPRGRIGALPRPGLDSFALTSAIRDLLEPSGLYSPRYQASPQLAQHGVIKAGIVQFQTQLRWNPVRSRVSRDRPLSRS